MYCQSEVQMAEAIELDEAVAIENELVLYNDDVNTFDHVIETLIRVCQHEPLQAEQCAIIVHYKGKCTVKTGAYDQLVGPCSALLDAGLSAQIH